MWAAVRLKTVVQGIVLRSTCQIKQCPTPPTATSSLARAMLLKRQNKQAPQKSGEKMAMRVAPAVRKQMPALEAVVGDGECGAGSSMLCWLRCAARVRIREKCCWRMECLVDVALMIQVVRWRFSGTACCVPPVVRACALALRQQDD